MMAGRISFVLILAVLGVVRANDAGVTPVQKVIQLLDNMVEKGTQDKQDEQVQFAKFKTFCDSTVSNKQRAIEEANEMMEVLTADVEKFQSMAQRLSKEIAQHDSDISTWEGDLGAATKVRAIENQDYIATAKDYDASIDAVDEGIAIINAQQKDVEQEPKKAAAVLTQIKNLKLIPDHSRKIIDSFIGHGVHQENLAVSAPEARAYESATTGVTDVLAELGRNSRLRTLTSMRMRLRRSVTSSFWRRTSDLK